MPENEDVIVNVLPVIGKLPLIIVVSEVIIAAAFEMPMENVLFAVAPDRTLSLTNNIFVWPGFICHCRDWKDRLIPVRTLIVEPN